MKNPTLVRSHNLLFLFLFLSLHIIRVRSAKESISAENKATEFDNQNTSTNHQLEVAIGLILDLNSSMGAMIKSCIDMAVSDFYASHPTYKTRLVLHPKDSNTVIGAASAALELLKNEEVKAILGPQSFAEETIVAELGEKAHVPVISFSGTRSSFSPIQRPYFIQSAAFDFSQLIAISAIVQGFKWQEVVFIYEDNVNGNGLLPPLFDSFKVAHIRLSYTTAISPSAKDEQISCELDKLKKLETTVFVVHMNLLLGYRFFVLAKAAGMMSKGYAWIITDALTNSLRFIDLTYNKSMDGVLGIRPYVPMTKKLHDFTVRWKRNSLSMKPSSITNNELNIYGLWAYDSIWTLAMAIERIGIRNLSSANAKSNSKGSDISQLGISEIGWRLFKEILNTTIEDGLSGKYYLAGGRLATSSYEILNIDGGERIVGYWSPDRGINRRLGSSDKSKLKEIIWPGDSTEKPKGWVIPKVGTKLKVSVPVKLGFTEFVKVGQKNHKVTGFCIDLFEAALKLLPFEVVPEYIPFMNASGGSNGTFDELLNQLLDKTVDAVVGDTTIVARRARHFEFTFPYSDLGMVMVAPIKDDKPKGIWVFVKPFRWDLWLTIVVVCICVALAIRILERHVKPKWKVGPTFWFPLSILAFPERGRVDNKWSRFVLVIWLFMAYIIMQSYTASLSSILTIDQLHPSRTKYSCIGFNKGSFVKNFLIQKLSYNESQLRPYETVEEYDTALKLGCEKGGVDAIFDEIPYVKLFLHKYGSKYMMVGKTYHSDGFAFAFPSGSTLASYMSEAMLKVTESDAMQKIEDDNFGPNYSSQDFNPKSQSLTSYNFAGLFSITGFATVFALFCSEIPFLWKKYHIEKRSPFSKIDTEDNSVNATPGPSPGLPDHSHVDEAPTDGEIQLVQREHVDEAPTDGEIQLVQREHVDEAPTDGEILVQREQ